MNALSIIKEQKTITVEQWSEIRKISEVYKIKTLIADLLESAPELNITDMFEFIQGLTERELRKRNCL